MDIDVGVQAIRTIIIASQLGHRIVALRPQEDEGVIVGVPHPEEHLGGAIQAEDDGLLWALATTAGFIVILKALSIDL